MIWDERDGWVGYEPDDRDPNEDPDDDDYARSMWDPVEGWVDAV